MKHDWFYFTSYKSQHRRSLTCMAS